MTDTRRCAHRTDRPLTHTESEEEEEEEEEVAPPPKKKAKGGKAAAKADEDVEKFYKNVNMTLDELTKWIDSPESQESGWTGGSGSGETVGHESGRKIIEILKVAPDASSVDKLDDELRAHMKKVNAYVAALHF